MYNRGYQERLDDDTLVPRRSDFDKFGPHGYDPLHILMRVMGYW